VPSSEAVDYFPSVPKYRKRFSRVFLLSAYYKARKNFVLKDRKYLVLMPKNEIFIDLVKALCYKSASALSIPISLKKEEQTVSKILQVNFNYNVSEEEYSQTVASLADAFANVSGCQWKIWLVNEERKEAGGIYLFEDDASIQAMLDSELIAGVTSHPALSNFSVKQFDVLEDVSRITRAPIGERTTEAAAG
jgi:hypothetical protein